jgi:hypothetical protein
MYHAFRLIERAIVRAKIFHERELGESIADDPNTLSFHVGCHGRDFLVNSGSW